MKLVTGWARESRGSRGRLLFFTACLAVGVAGVVSVRSVVSAIQDGIRGQSRELLACDYQVSGRRPLPEQLDGFMDRFASFERTDVRELATMLRPLGSADDARSDALSDVAPRLCQLHSIRGVYPLYGALEMEPAGTLADFLGPEKAVVDRDFAQSLDLRVGDRVRMGGAEFEVAALASQSTGRLEFSMALAPRVYVSDEGLARTALLGFGNRVRYRALYSLPDNTTKEQLAALERDMKSGLEQASYLRFESHTEGQPSIRRSIDRTESFLGLVALLSLILGGVGVSVVVRAWLKGKAQATAILRCLGYRPREVFQLYLGHIVILSLIGSLVGAALGALCPLALTTLAPETFPPDALDLFQPNAILRGVGLGIFVAICFSLPPLAAVWRVSPARALRAEAEPLPPHRLVRYGSFLALVGATLFAAWLQSDSWLVASVFTASLFALAGVLYLAAKLMMRGLGRVPRRKLSPYLAVGFAALGRPGAATVGAVVALGLGVLVVVSMLVVENRISAELSSSLPDTAPSAFLVDIQPDQWDGLREELAGVGAEHVDSVPVVMARLAALDGVEVETLAKERGKDRPRWVFTREQRLTWMKELSEDNEILAGALWNKPGVNEVSIEEGFAKDLGAELGSTLRFDVQGILIDLEVTSIRKVEWQSFSINFFLVVEPGVLEEAPHFRIAAARLDGEQEAALESRVVDQFPNVTVLKIRPILEKVLEVLSQLALGVKTLGSLTVLCGLAILFGAVASTTLERRKEAALFKTLGVTRRGVATLFLCEHLLCGALSGLIGGTAANALAWVFLTQTVELDPNLPLWSIPAATLASALLSGIAGLTASRSALQAPPREVLAG